MTGIDLFAGLGGWTEGARLAGVEILWAANHWPAAVEIHALNHPSTVHRCQDLRQTDWSTVPRHDLLLASPCCQGHTKARGKERPRYDASRATAWAVVECAEYHRPAGFIAENVREFLEWALYPAWKAALEALGYKLSPHFVDAADHGVPQFRERVFVVGTLSRAPLKLELPRRPHRPASEILEPTGDTSDWTPVRTLCAATRERVREGRRRYGERFVVAYYGNEAGGRSLERPLGTITTRDRFGLVHGDRLRMLTATEYRRGMGFHEFYRLPRQHKLAVHLLGNAVCPLPCADIIQAFKAAA